MRNLSLSMDKAFNGTVVNRSLSSLHGGSLEINPFKNEVFMNQSYQDDISVIFRVFDLVLTQEVY